MECTRPTVTSTKKRPLTEQPTADFLGGGLFLFDALVLIHPHPGALHGGSRNSVEPVKIVVSREPPKWVANSKSGGGDNLHP